MDLHEKRCMCTLDYVCACIIMYHCILLVPVNTNHIVTTQLLCTKHV